MGPLISRQLTTNANYSKQQTSGRGLLHSSTLMNMNPIQLPINPKLIEFNPQASSKGFDSHNENSEIITSINNIQSSTSNSLKPKLFRISSNKNMGNGYNNSQNNKLSHGYISKLPSTSQTVTQKKNTIQKAQQDLENFILESAPKQVIIVPKQIDMTLTQPNEFETQSLLKGNLQSDNMPSPTDQWKEQHQLIENFYQQRYGSKQNSGGNSTEEKRVKFMQNESESQIQYDKELLDADIVGKIENYKVQNDKKIKQFHKIIKDYEKSDVVSRIQKYGKKTLYEDLKLQEIDLKKQLRINAQLEAQDYREMRNGQQDMIQKNILQQSNGSEYQVPNDLGQIPPNIPFSNMALFTNLSEKERFIKFSTEFNKLKAQLEAHRHEDYSITLLYLKAKIGFKIGEPSREQVKNFMKFVKDDKRLFDLRKQFEEIIIDAMDGSYSEEKLQELHERKKRAQTAEIAQTLNMHQNRLLEMLDQYKTDLGQNYVLWNQKAEFNYDGIPNKYPLTGPRRKVNRRRNKLNYQRKVPYGNQPMKLHTIMSSYIDDNKKLSAKEFIPPSLEDQYPCAVNFNKETVNTVLNFAQESKVRLMSSMSTNTLTTKPTTGSAYNNNQISDLKRNQSVSTFNYNQSSNKKSTNELPAMTTAYSNSNNKNAFSNASNSIAKSQSQVVLSNIQDQNGKLHQNQPSTSALGNHQQSVQVQGLDVNSQYQKISKLHNVESESVFKRNRLMLEHVMLERAIKKLNTRKERKEARKLQEQNGGTNDWKMRQAISNEVFEMQRTKDSKNKRATIEDKDHILYLMNDNAKLVGGFEKDKFEFAGEYVLKNEDYGFFILAYDERSQQDEEQSSGQDMKRASGFMFFTFEWSDWRNGLFFIMQSCHVVDEYRKAGVFNKMYDFLQQVIKDRNCVGIRLFSEIRLEKLWAPIIKKFDMKRSHYHVYEIEMPKTSQ